MALKIMANTPSRGYQHALAIRAFTAGAEIHRLCKGHVCLIGRQQRYLQASVLICISWSKSLDDTEDDQPCMRPCRAGCKSGPMQEGVHVYIDSVMDMICFEEPLTPGARGRYGGLIGRNVDFLVTQEYSLLRLSGKVGG